MVRNGRAPDGRQRYGCRDGGRRSREAPRSQAYSAAERETILRAYQERASLRGLRRVFGVSPTTVSGWLKKKALSLPPLASLLRPPRAEEPLVLEWDELWSFVGRKARVAGVWVALDRAKRPVVACVLGDRSAATCRALWEQVPAPWRVATCYSDFWEAYQAVIPAEQHRAVGQETGETAHVERWNNTLRQRWGRFVRKTLSFSKSDRMHGYGLALFLHAYNRSLASP